MRDFTAACETCHKTRCHNRPPKAPLSKMFIPNKPMQFISIDIAYLPTDNSGYNYILLVGDIFSKFITTVPLKDQTASVVASALLNNWIYVHRPPLWNIHTVKDMLRSVLLHRRIPQTQWHPILHQLVFALNTTTSKSTNCVPYNVIFGRSATLPQDVVFQ